jgi:hypothetical protein
MVVVGKLQSPGTLPQWQELKVLTEYEAARGSEPVWVLGKKKNTSHCGNRTVIPRSSCQ